MSSKREVVQVSWIYYQGNGEIDEDVAHRIGAKWMKIEVHGCKVGRYKCIVWLFVHISSHSIIPVLPEHMNFIPAQILYLCHLD